MRSPVSVARVGEFLVFEEAADQLLGADTRDARKIIGRCLRLILEKHPELRTAVLVDYVREGVRLMREIVGPAEPPAAEEMKPCE
jgi:hypothetical protein